VPHARGHEICLRYQAKASEENARIADWRVRLTTADRDWGSGLCFLRLRNARGFGCSHKRAYRIRRELELNLRVEPKKRLVQASRAFDSGQGHDPGLVDRLRPRPARRRTQLSLVQGARRLQPRRLTMSMAIEADLSLPSARVIRSLDQIIEWRGRPQQDAHVERYNRAVRHAWLARTLFGSIEQGRTTLPVGPRRTSTSARTSRSAAPLQ
jgi:putative transposase